MIWAEMDYDEQLASIATLARDGNSISMIARVLGTTEKRVSVMMHEHGLAIRYARPGHAVPASDDEGFGGGDPFVRKMAAWRRASEGARKTLENRLTSTEEILG